MLIYRNMSGESMHRRGYRSAWRKHVLFVFSLFYI